MEKGFEVHEKSIRFLFKGCLRHFLSVHWSHTHRKSTQGPISVHELTIS